MGKIYVETTDSGQYEFFEDSMNKVNISDDCISVPMRVSLGLDSAIGLLWDDGDGDTPTLVGVCPASMLDDFREQFAAFYEEAGLSRDNLRSTVLSSVDRPTLDLLNSDDIDAAVPILELISAGGFSPGPKSDILPD